ncbi:MAG TPA: carboxypeptidase-like regulatory domain-containing protein, partial [Planctomycetota bacterium]|nr:carboxypeptidase-like regulatory domain-containing protein [Planctomycetota bacterium]
QLAVPPGLDVDGVDFEVVRTAHVSGRVIDGDGAAVPGADIGSTARVLGELLEDREIAPLGTGRADPRGAFRIAVPAGQVTVSARDDHRSGETEVRWVEPGAEVTGVEVVIDAQPPDAGLPDYGNIEIIEATPSESATVAGVVRGPDGPLAVFDVELSTFGNKTLGTLRFVAADGRYLIDRLAPVPSDVTISAPGLAPALVHVELRKGQVADGSATLSAGANVEGTVTDAHSGRPLAGVRLSMNTGQDYALAYSDARGHYQLRDVAPGRRSMEAHQPTYVGRIVALVLESGATARQDVMLEPLTGPAAQVELAGIGAILSIELSSCMVKGTVPG